MNINIIGTLRNSKGTTVGYLLMDLDDNNKTMTVSKEQLIKVLKLKKLKLANAKLVQDRVMGTYYPLTSLSYMMSDRVVRSMGLLVLGNVGMDYICVTWSTQGIDTRLYSLKELRLMYNNRLIINVDKSGKLSFPSIKVNKIGYNDIDEDALDENKVWNLEQFKTFMGAHNWKYELVQDGNGRYILYDIDPNCDIVHLPYNIFRVKNLYRGRPINKIKAIIINSAFDTLGSLYPDIFSDKELVDIGKICIQSGGIKGDKAIDHYYYLDGLSFVRVLQYVSIPNYSSIRSFCNNSIIQMINAYGDNIDITGSFNNTRINSGELAIDYFSIFGSFNEIKGIHTVNIGRYVHNIKQSFSESGIQDLCLDNAINMESIDGFNGLYGRRIDFSHCDRLKSISGFGRCTGLEEVILDIKAVDQLNLHGSVGIPLFQSGLLKEVVVNNSIHSIDHLIGGEDTKVIFDESVNRVNTQFYKVSGDYVKKLNIIYRSRCLRIEDRVLGYKYSDFNDLGIENDQIKSFSSGVFSWSGIEKFDSAEYTQLEAIEDNLFNQCYRLHTVILDSNIKHIGSNVLQKCDRLMEIAVSESIEDIEDNAFSAIRSKEVIKAYVVKGSKAYNIIKKKTKKQFMIIEVESLEDARKIISGESKTDDTTISRFRALLGANPKYDKLFAEPYIRSIKFIYKLYNDVMQKREAGLDNVPSLDNSKYREADINTYGVLDYYNEVIQKAVESNVTDNDYIFNAMSNLVTHFLDRNDIFYGIDILKKLRFDALSRLIYRDTRRVIATFSYSALEITSITLLMIIIDGKIQFISDCADNYMNDSDTDNIVGRGIFKKKNESMLNESKFTISNMLRRGDRITSGRTDDSLISGVYIPSILNDSKLDLVNIFKVNSIVLYSDPSGYRSKKIEMLYYDLIYQRFILVSCQSGWGFGAIDKDISTFLIQDIYTWDTIGELGSKYLQFINTLNKDKNATKRLINFLNLSKEDIQAVYSDSNNYDMNNTDLYKVAINVKTNHINNADGLGAELAMQILQSDLYSEKGYTLNALNNSKSNYILNREIEHKNWSILEYVTTNTDRGLKEIHANLGGKDAKYLYFIKTGKTTPGKKQKCFCGWLSLDEIITISKKSMVGTGNPLNYITNEEIKASRFMILVSHGSSYGSRDMLISLALDKYNCDPYIIVQGRYDSDDYCKTLFRFKHILYAIDFLEKRISNSDWAFKNLCSSLYKGIEDDSTSDRTFSSSVRISLYNGIKDGKERLWTIRNLILQNFPNNLEYPGPDIDAELLEQLAKQPLQ